MQHGAPLETVRLRVASTVSCTAAVHVYAALSVTYNAPCVIQAHKIEHALVT